VARKAGLKKRPAEYYRMLYADTSLNGSAPATRCGHAFFGTSHCLFATDAPFDAEQGRMLIRETINAVNALEIPKAEKEKIFSGNARSLLKLN
jgi:aminocarboxymuconate-semialdehyde decarboxylase